MKLIASFKSASKVKPFSAKDYYLCTLNCRKEFVLERTWTMAGEGWKRVNEIPETIKGYNPELLGESD